MQENGESRSQSPSWGLSVVSIKTLGVAAAFGLAALAMVVAGLTLPIPGTGVVTDPREIFTTTGAALTGPVGGVLIGVLAGVREPGGVVIASLIAHVSGGLWMGLAYKMLVHRFLRVPFSFIGWVFLVLAYYYVFVIPGFVLGQAVFYSDGFIDSYGLGTSLFRAYTILGWGATTPGWGALPEAVLTALVTTLAFIALPRRNRRPLW